jgi:hypothetical protein
MPFTTISGANVAKVMNLHIFPRAVVASVGTLFSSYLSFEITADKLLAGIVSLLCAVLAAFLASRPAMLNYRMQRRDREIEFLKGRIKYHANVAVILRATSHDVIASWINDQDYAKHLQQLLRDNKIAFKDRPFINPMTFKSEEDVKIAALEAKEETLHVTEPAI